MKKRMQIKKCKHCGREFETEIGSKAVLCGHCRNYFLKQCEKCGATFRTIKEDTKLCAKCRKYMNQSMKMLKKRNGLRPCHDCGKMITNYRCPSCWEEWRRKNGVYIRDINSVSDDDE
ncbi:MAG: hypothetical protein HDQ88_12035 [Clostridia bacterium]|nr:hypothetical protein [Clostridia bacterium]